MGFLAVSNSNGQGPEAHSGLLFRPTHSTSKWQNQNSNPDLWTPACVEHYNTVR